MTFKRAECSIRVTALLENLDLALNTRSWVSLHNSLAFTQVLLYYCKELLWWLLQLQIDFQLTTVDVCSITGWIFIRKFDCAILTPVGFCIISPLSFSGFISNHKKALLLCLLHLDAKFQLNPRIGLLCRRDKKINIVLCEQVVLAPEIFTGFALK